MPVKAPMYLKAPPNKKGKKPRLRDILSPDMISPPLGDFRHLMHIGGAAMDDYAYDGGGGDNHDVPDHCINREGNHINRDLRHNYQQHHQQQQQQINHILHQQQQQQQPALRTGQPSVHNTYCLDAMRSPVLKNALTLPFMGSPRALDLPYLSPHYGPAETSPPWTPGARHSIAVAPPQGNSSSRGAASKDGHLRKPKSSGSIGGGAAGDGRWSGDGAPYDRRAEEDEDLDVFAEADEDLATKPWLRPQAGISRSLSVPVHGGRVMSPSSPAAAAAGGDAAVSTGRVFSVPSLAHGKAPSHHMCSTLTRDGSTGEGIGKSRSGQRSNRFLQTMLVNAKLSKLFHRSSKNNVGDGGPGGSVGGGGGGGGFDDGTNGAGLSGQKTNSTTRLWNRFSFSRGRDGSSSGGGGDGDGSGDGSGSGGSKSSSAAKLRSSPLKATHRYPEALTLGREGIHDPGKAALSGGQSQRGRLVEPSSRYSWSGSLQKDIGNVFVKVPFTAGRTSPGGDGNASTWVGGSTILVGTETGSPSLTSSSSALTSAALSTSQPLLSVTPVVPLPSPPSSVPSPFAVAPPHPPPSALPSVAPPPPLSSALPSVAPPPSSLSGTPWVAPPPSCPSWAELSPSYDVSPSLPSAELMPAPTPSSSSSSSLSSSATRQPLARNLFQRSRLQISAAFRSGIFHSRRRSPNPAESEEVVFQNGISQTQDRFVVGPTRHPPAELCNGTPRFVCMSPVDCAIDQAGVQEILKGAVSNDNIRQQEEDALDCSDFGEIAMQRHPRQQQPHHHHDHQNRQILQQQQQQEQQSHHHHHLDHHQHQPNEQHSPMRRWSSKDSPDAFHRSGSLLSLDLDLGPSLLVEVLGVMDKPAVPCVGVADSRGPPGERDQSPPERDSGVGCSDGELPHSATTPSPLPPLK